MARIFATLNPSALGPFMELEDGGLVVTTNTGGLSINRLARGTVPVVSGRSFFEVAFYGEGALLDQAAVGIVRSTHGLAKYVGEQSTGWGLKVGNGGIFNNNAQSVATDPVGKEVYIGVLVDMDAFTCTWFVNGTPIGSVSIANAFWYPAITVSSQIAYDLRCYVNFGQYAFEYPQTGENDRPENTIPGWFQNTVTPTQLHLCGKNARAFHSTASDSIPLITFEPRIIDPQKFQFARKCSVWTSGSRSDSSSFSNIDLDNRDGRFDTVAGEDRRDQIVTVLVANTDDTFNNAEVVCTGVVDSVRAVGESAIRVTIKDRLTTLERVFQRRRMPPWADDGVANTPVPVTLGAVRNVSPPLEDAVNRRYRLHDAPITNIVSVRDKGAPLDPNSSPPQYFPTGDADGIELQTDAVGLLTVDMSSQGSQVVIPGAADILSGAGAFTTWPNPAAEPPGWLVGGAVSVLARQGLAQSMPQNYVVSLSATEGFNPANGDVGAWLRFDTANLLPGKTYRVQFKLVRAYGSPSNGMRYGLMVRSDLSILASGAVSPHMEPLQAPQFGVTGQAYTFVHTVPAGAARKLYFIACCAMTSNGVPVGTVGGVVFYDVKVELLGQISAALPLEGIQLGPYLREVFRRGQEPTTGWSEADAIAIDTATGYDFGVNIQQPVNVRQAAQMPLDSYGATMFTDKLARYRFRRLRDPSIVPDNEISASFTESDIPFGIEVLPDLAVSLTTQMGARKNWRVFQDSDFVTDTLTVPPALRTQFKREYQFIEPFASTMAPTYQFATLAPPIGSLFDDAEFARAEIARMCAPYIAGRIRPGTGQQILTSPRFIGFTFFYDSLAPPDLMFGDIIKVTYRRHRLDAGQKLAVFDITVTPGAKRCQVLAWGTE